VYLVEIHNGNLPLHLQLKKIIPKLEQDVATEEERGREWGKGQEG